MNTRIKICGITCVEDALAVAEMGADEIGLNFYIRSPRYVDPEKARQIAAEIPSGVKTVGVFVNESTEAVLAVTAYVGLDGIQLHGEESEEYIGQMREATDRFIIKAMNAASLRSFALAKLPVDAVLIDSPHNGEYGGTGDTFDWGVLTGMPIPTNRIYLAGGLGPSNVAAAIRQVRPYAVDACSRLESIKGRKNLEKVAEFIQEARRV